MKLLEPYFLYAFLALAIPIIIHLFSLQRHKIIYFSNVSILKELEQKKRSINSFKKLLLLLIRLLLLSSIILAFCEPYISKDKAIDTDKHLVGIYLDNSFSMNGDNDKGILIEQAKNKARNILNSYNNNQEFIFITNELAGKHQRILDHNECLEAIDQTYLKPNFLGLNSIIGRWNSLTQNLGNRSADFYLISDFQKSSFPEKEFINNNNKIIHLLPISSYPKTNISIDTCYLEFPNHNLGDQEWLNFKISNHSSKDINNLSIKLIINGEQKALTNISIKAESNTSSKVSFTNSKLGENQAYIEINDETLIFDNRLYFNYLVTKTIKVLTIYEDEEQNSLIEVFRDEIYDYKAFNINNVNLSDFSKQNFIILDGIKTPSSGLIKAVEVFTKNGGNLLIIPNHKIDYSSYNLLSKRLNIPIFNKIINNKNIKVSTINQEHFLFKNVFDERNDEYQLPKVFYYYSLNGSYSKSEENVMKLNTKDPFINSYKFELGTCYLMCSPLNENATNIEQHALFLPLLYNMAIQKNDSEKIYYTIGKDKSIQLKDYSNLSPWKITKEGSIDFQPEYRLVNQEIQININQMIQEDGFFILSNGNQEYTISFNYDRMESELNVWDIDDLEILSKMSNHIKIWKEEGLDLEVSLSENKEGKKIWYYIIFISLALLIIESFLLKNNNTINRKES